MSLGAARGAECKSSRRAPKPSELDLETWRAIGGFAGSHLDSGDIGRIIGDCGVSDAR